MIDETKFNEQCKKVPGTYPDFYNGFYQTVVDSGCCDEVYSFMISNKNATSSDVIKYYFEYTGGIPEPITVAKCNTDGEKLAG